MAMHENHDFGKVVVVIDQVCQVHHGFIALILEQTDTILRRGLVGNIDDLGVARPKPTLPLYFGRVVA